MFSRIKKLAKQKPRQLIASSLYDCYTILVVSNLIINRDSLTNVDIGILVPSITMLAAAVAHSLGRSIHAVVVDNNHAEDEQVQNYNHAELQVNNRPLIRASTHNIVNSILHLGSSAGFIAYDSLILSETVPLPIPAQYSAIAVRTAGLGLWNLSAGISLFHALAHDRREENHPDKKVHALGIHPETYNLSVEVLLIIASILFAYEFYTEDPINPFKAAAIPCWMLAGLINTIAASYDFHHRNDAPVTPAATITPPAEQQNEFVIQLSSTEEPEASSEEERQSYGM